MPPSALPPAPSPPSAPTTATPAHYGYARQDRKAGPREPITARLVANLLECAGVDRIITLDLHQGQIQGFFDIPVNHLSALPLFADYYDAMGFDTDNLVVVSPIITLDLHQGQIQGFFDIPVNHLSALPLFADYYDAMGFDTDNLVVVSPDVGRALDLHQGQIQGFFDIPVNHLSALPLFADYYDAMGFDTDNLVVVSPDVGRAKAAKKLSDMLGCSLAIAHKGRPRHNAAEVMGIIGDIKGKTCIINDDMIDLFADYYDAMGFDTDNLVVVSPDVGRAKAAKKLSDMLGCSLAIAHKGRPRHNAAEVMGIIGDIKGKTCIINEDMIDTAGTLCANVRELKALGAGDIYVCATHGIFSGEIKGKTCIINEDMIDTAGTLCANVRELKALGAGDIYVCATHGIFSGEAVQRLNDAPIVTTLRSSSAWSPTPSPSRWVARSRPTPWPESSPRPSPPCTTSSP